MRISSTGAIEGGRVLFGQIGLAIFMTR
jgi:hypothetical protein